MTRRISIDRREPPGDEDREAILAILSRFNADAAPPIDAREVAFLARDEEGSVVGGLWGRIAYGWLFVQYLALEPASRGAGLGRELMLAAEEAARAGECTGIWLDTFSFQARGFYKRLGYTLFGTLTDYPPGHSRHFLCKRLG